MSKIWYDQNMVCPKYGMSVKQRKGGKEERRKGKERRRKGIKGNGKGLGDHAHFFGQIFKMVRLG